MDCSGIIRDQGHRDNNSLHGERACFVRTCVFFCVSTCMHHISVCVFFCVCVSVLSGEHNHIAHCKHMLLRCMNVLYRFKTKFEPVFYICFKRLSVVIVCQCSRAVFIVCFGLRHCTACVHLVFQCSEGD